MSTRCSSLGSALFVVVMATFVVCGDAGCTVRDSTALRGDALRHLVDSARAYEKADQLDDARRVYEEAAGEFPTVADWLRLRAAAITKDSAHRAALYAMLSAPAARDRVDYVEAIARERTDDLRGALRAFRKIGARLSALRIRERLATTADERAQVRRDLLTLLDGTDNPELLRSGVELFDDRFAPPSPAEELALARAAYDAGWNARALNSFKAAFRHKLGTGTDHYHYGMALVAAGRESQAMKEFRHIDAPRSAAADAAYQRARIYLGRHQLDDARIVLRLIAKRYPAERAAASALYLLADLATDEGRDDDAKTALRSLIDGFPHDRLTPIALFRIGIIDYAAGDLHSAARTFDRLVKEYSTSDEVLAGTYWSGRAHAADGDTAAARQRWDSIIKAEPASYYAVLSAKRLGTEIPIVHDTTPEVDPPFIDSVEDRLSLLKAAGMEDERRYELRDLARAVDRTPDLLVPMSQLFISENEMSRAITLGWRALSNGERTDRMYRIVFPIVGQNALRDAAHEHDLDPVMIAALIRQESNFNPRAVSPVGARGLMQLMPSVARQIAKSKGISPWSIDRLQEPAVNIELGTAHFASLAHRYDQPVKVFAAYNAGESRVERWSTKHGVDDPELFVERIPFTETRDYVRAVERNREFYKRLYDW